MSSTNFGRTLAAVALAAGLTAAPAAQAHISMKGALMSRGGDQKNFPCDGKRGDGPVYTFQPGTTITLSVSEDVPHPSYFRIAFDNDGEDNFIEPKSIKPIDPNRGCPTDPKDQCGESDFCNVKSSTGGATVLWDNIEPHLSGGSSYTWTIKLPDVECENCTLQVLQIMEDDLFHGPYCPTGSCTDTSLEDIYHRCIDIKLQKGAMNSAGVATGAVNVKGMECAPSTAMPTAGTGAAGMSAAGAGGAAGAAGAAAGAAGSSGATAGAAAAAGASGGAATGAGGVAGIGMRMNANTAAGAPASAGSAAVGAAGTGSSAAGTGAGLVAPTAGTPATTAGSAAPAGAAAPVSGAPAPTAISDDGCSVTGVGQSNRVPTAGLLLLLAAVLISRRRQRT